MSGLCISESRGFWFNRLSLTSVEEATGFWSSISTGKKRKYSDVNGMTVGACFKVMVLFSELEQRGYRVLITVVFREMFTRLYNLIGIGKVHFL